MKGEKTKKRRYAFSLKDLLRFYTRFRIPWWMYIISVLIGFVSSELAIRTARYTISINKGELYNSVIIGYALMTLLGTVISAAQVLFSEYAALRVTLRARRTVWQKILHLPMSEVDRRQPSALISGVTNDVGTASSLLTMFFLMFTSLYSFGRACVEVFRFNTRLALLMMVTVPLAVVVFTVVGRMRHEIDRRTYAALRVMTEFFSEHVSAAKNVKTQAMEDQEEKAGLKAIDEQFKAALYAAVMTQVYVALFSFYSQVDTVLIAIFGSSMIRKGQMETTGINDFSTYMDKVHQYLSENLTHYETLRGTQGSLQYVGEMLEGPQEEPDRGEPAPEGVGDIVLDHVTFGYLPDTPVLRDVSLTIPAGRVTAIIGNNGSGKSTILKLLQGVYSVGSGRITVNGRDCSAMAPHELRRQFGYILQNNPLFSGTVRDNILYGAPEAGEEAMVRAAALADADGFIRELPQGYDTDIGEGGKLLSGGQRQRVAIARTLITDPNYLLMDEAGASLDHKSDDTIFRSVRQSLKGRTIVVVAHDMRSVVEADHIIVMDRGRVEAEGTHQELLRTSPTYQGYLAKQGYILEDKEAER